MVNSVADKAQAGKVGALDIEYCLGPHLGTPLPFETLTESVNTDAYCVTAALAKRTEVHMEFRATLGTFITVFRHGSEGLTTENTK